MQYSHTGFVVEDGDEEIVSAGVFDDEEYEMTGTYDHQDELRWYECDGGECSDSRSYDNETDTSRVHRGQGIRTSATDDVEVAWCDSTSYRRVSDSEQAKGDRGLLLSRDTYHAENATAYESCRKGVRTMGVEVAPIRCDRTTRTSLRTEEHYRPETGVTWDGEGTREDEMVCLLGAWREVDAGVASADVRAGYEETLRDCYPACGPEREEALVARANVEGPDGERRGVDERVAISSPMRVMT